MSRRTRLWVIIISIAMAISIVATIEAINMGNQDNIVTQLEGKIRFLDVATIVALAATVIFGALLIKYHDQLDGENKKQAIESQNKIAASEERSQIAQRDAANAMAVASEAQARQKEAELKEKEVELELAQLRLSVKQTSEKTDIASEKAESAQKRVREVAKKTENRRIPESLIPGFRSELSKYRNESITITAVIGDQESFSFASQLKTIFESSGWKVNGVNQGAYTGPILGIVIVLKSKSDQPKGELIAKLFESLKLVLRGEINDKSDSGVSLIVGAR